MLEPLSVAMTGSESEDFRLLDLFEVPTASSTLKEHGDLQKEATRSIAHSTVDSLAAASTHDQAATPSTRGHSDYAKDLLESQEQIISKDSIVFRPAIAPHPLNVLNETLEHEYTPEMFINDEALKHIDLQSAWMPSKSELTRMDSGVETFTVRVKIMRIRPMRDGFSEISWEPIYLPSAELLSPSLLDRYNRPKHKADHTLGHRLCTCSTSPDDRECLLHLAHINWSEFPSSFELGGGTLPKAQCITKSTSSSPSKLQVKKRRRKRGLRFSRVGHGG